MNKRYLIIGGALVIVLPVVALAWPKTERAIRTPYFLIRGFGLARLLPDLIPLLTHLANTEERSRGRPVKTPAEPREASAP